MRPSETESIGAGSGWRPARWAPEAGAAGPRAPAAEGPVRDGTGGPGKQPGRRAREAARPTGVESGSVRRASSETDRSVLPAVGAASGR